MAKDLLVWLDLEMTGLDVTTNVIIEIATVVTDGSLNVIAEGPNIAISQSEEKLNEMDAWNQNQHNGSGLVERVRESNIVTKEAEAQTLAFLTEHVAAGKSPLCGNSVHTDRKFLEKYMPELAAFFHYRHLDVSTVKELAKRWAPDLYNNMEKETDHLALGDVLASIDELKYYQNNFFKLNT